MTNKNNIIKAPPYVLATFNFAKTNITDNIDSSCLLPSEGTFEASATTRKSNWSYC